MIICNSRFWLITGFLLFILYPLHAVYSQDTLIKLKTKQEAYIENNLKIHRSGSRSENINDILSAEKNGTLTFTGTDKTNFGFTKEIFWLKLEISYSGVIKDWFLELQYPLIDSADFYLVSDAKIIQHEFIGDSVPYSCRSFPGKTPLFKPDFTTNGIYSIYLRLETSGTMRFPLILWPADIFIHKNAKENTIYGIYYGFLLMLFVLLVLIYFNQKTISFIYFAVFIFLGALFESIQTGTLFELTMPANTANKFSLYILSGTIALLSFSKFIYEFLQLRNQSVFLRYSYTGLAVFGFAVIISLPTGDKSFSIHLFSILGLFTLIPNFAAALTMTHRGRREGIFFLVAMGFFLVAVIVFALRGFGFLPSNMYTLFTKEIAILMLTLILTLGIVDKFNTFRLQSISDSLTGLANRRHFLELTKNEIERSKRTRSPLTLLMIDIDHFKEINDTYGHPAGDRLLVEFTKKVKSLLRGMDTAARVGGEEFAFLMPETNTYSGEQAANRIRQSVEKMEVLYEKKKISFTVSIGISSISADNDTIEKIIYNADKALYEAKRSGRNRVCIYSA